MTGHNTTDNLPGRQLDEYRLESLLGKGGMARVYRGFDVKLKRQAAIKVIDTPYRRDSAYVERFAREAQAVAQLKHPHIVGIYRFGEAEGVLYIAMEYIEGANLEKVLDSYRADQQLIEPAEAGRVIGQVCQALHYAHSHGVIHRDIKPSNIMLNRQGQVVLTDFGLALLEDQRTRGEVFGSPHYISPEQAISSAKAVPQSDLYAVGVILYEMFTGQLPFQADHPHDVALLHVSELPQPPRSLNPDLSPELEAVILKALAKEPAERYPDGLALIEALQQVLPAEPVEISVVTPPTLLAPAGPSLNPDTPQPKKGHALTSHYLLGNIRRLLSELTAGLSPEELRQLYYAVPDFKAIHHQLADSRGKAEIINRLLDYAEQTLQVDKVLALAREYDPVAYEKYKPYQEFTSGNPADLIGKNLGKYHIIEWLGQGGMAQVYKAYQPGLARFVAIKIIHSHLLDNEEFIERFEHEAMAVANLRHPNIVQVFDFDREGDRCYMVMEFIEGPTLQAEIEARRANQSLLPLSETVIIVKSLAEAIDYAHSRGMIHRDLKPGNILFTPKKRVVLTDFGIARFMDVPSYTMTNAIVGTPAYMSPEQAQGEPVDERSDIYSLGVILYEMATGQVPFQDASPVAVILKLVSGSWPVPTSINPNLPPPVEDVILKAMSHHPANRFATAGALLQALQQAVAGEPTNLMVRPPQELERGPAKALDKAEIPEVVVPPLPAANEPAGPHPPLGRAGTINISDNRGQIALGGHFSLQIGDVYGGQVSLNSGLVQPQEPVEPAAADLTPLHDGLADLKRRIEASDSATKPAELERLRELAEALTATPPDLDTMAYTKRWFAKNKPALDQAIDDLILHPVVKRLIAVAGQSVSAEYKRRFAG
jgi:serine/threonine protein kinase